WRRLVAIAFSFALLVAVMPTAPAGAAHTSPGSALITLNVGGGTVTPIIDVGQTHDGLLFEGLPDGIGVRPGPTEGTVDVYVTHEQTTVPFFGSSDFQDASVSKLTLDVATNTINSAEVALGPENGYLRFCSASMAGPAEGFSTYTLFANEETDDIVDVPAGAPYGPDPGLAGQRQGGYVVVLDTDTGEFTQVAGMGRHNHENTIAVPGYNQLAMLSTDDTFNAPSSQLYLYLANHESHVWQDKGSLWAFQVTEANGKKVTPTDPFNGANDYLDLVPGDEFAGKFIRVPKQIARGTTGEAPQAALEEWSNDNNVFQFIRLEDLAYDKNDPHTIYIADTGQSRIAPDPDTGRLERIGTSTGLADNGRVFKMVMNDNNPRKVDSLTVLAQGDDDGLDDFVGFTNPDNMDTSANSLMVQEDADDAQIWQYKFSDGSWTAVANVVDAGGESSGIVDVSEWYGEGHWLLDVQAHDFDFVDEELQPDGTLLKREAGQLLHMYIPGS
ncbi:MAG: PhoX family protein, partial [Acidimicrobiia bacterium]|nr:PhoX family protein [Acidimicrobiia bacterium]